MPMWGKYWEEDRLPKFQGETFHQKGQKVWLIKKSWSVTIKPQPGSKSFGEVLKDSIWPDMFVTVGIWNKDQFGEWSNRNLPDWIKKDIARKYAAYKNRKRVLRAPRV